MSLSVRLISFISLNSGPGSGGWAESSVTAFDKTTSPRRNNEKLSRTAASFEERCPGSGGWAESSVTAFEKGSSAVSSEDGSAAASRTTSNYKESAPGSQFFWAESSVTAFEKPSPKSREKIKAHRTASTYEDNCPGSGGWAEESVTPFETSAASPSSNKEDKPRRTAASFESRCPGGFGTSY